MRKIIVILLLSITVITGLIGCSSNEEKEIETENNKEYEELKTVRFGSPNNSGKMLFELLEVALEEGILDEELESVGYAGEYTPIDAAGPGINEAFASDEIDIAVYGDFPATLAKSNGIDTTIIGVANGSQAQAIFIRDDVDINDIFDLEGKTVAVGLGTNYQFYWENQINSIDTDLSKINVVNSYDYATLLTTGDVDAASISATQAVYFEKLGLGHTLVDSKNHPEWTTEFLVAARTSYIKENPEVGIAINKALIYAKQLIDSNPTSLYEASATETITADIVKEANERVGSYGYNPELLLTDTSEQLQSVIDFMYENELISTSVDATEWIDTSYYEKAKSEIQ